MQEVFEKIIEKLEELQNYACFPIECVNEEQSKIHSFYANKLTEILKLVSEYCNGWILCDIAMPEEHDSIFAKAKGTDKWNDAMFEKTSDTVNVTVADEFGNRTTTHAYTVDGQWSCDLLKLNKTYKIIAWQPLPEPYQSKGE